MKECFKCKKFKALTLFYVHKQMADGHLGKCKSCTKKDAKQRWLNPEARERIRLYDKKRFQDPGRKAKILKYKKRSREKRKGTYKARNKMTNALRDQKITRQPCVVCGNTKSQGHHSDYRKPLLIKWLCFKHHRIEHGQKPL